MLQNITKKTTFIPTVHWYRSLWKKGLGLMFRFSPPNYGVIFPFTPPQRAMIHMWFVFFPLDIFWLDEKGVVLEQRTLYPWTVHTPSALSSYVIELPAGTLLRTNTKVGDKTNINQLLTKK